MSEDMVASVEVTEGMPCKQGVQYELASGTLIPNLGEKNFVAEDEGGTKRRMKVQVCDVNKALLSVSKMVQAGNRVVFSKEESYVEDVVTGERMYMQDRGGMYMLKLWVKKPF
jgi:hypothetical protein